MTESEAAGVAMSPPVASPTPPKEPRRWKTWQLVTASVLALLLGVGIGGAGAGSEEADKDPETSAAVSAGTASNDDDEDDERTTTTEEERTTTTRRPTATTQAPYFPAAADFTLTIIETERSCFGSAGCNISYELELGYIGPRPLEPDATFQLIYEVRGGEDVEIGNIELEGNGSYTTRADYISTPPNPSLSAVVTAVRQR